MILLTLPSTLFPYTTLFRSILGRAYTEIAAQSRSQHRSQGFGAAERRGSILNYFELRGGEPAQNDLFEGVETRWSRYPRSEEHTSELQSRLHLVCRLLLEKK